jgi:hypothetical protein
MPSCHWSSLSNAAAPERRWPGSLYLPQWIWASLLLPPLAQLGALWVFWCGLIAAGSACHLLPAPLLWACLATLSGLGLLLYILIGLRLAGAPSAAYAALLRAPLYAALKMWL